MNFSILGISLFFFTSLSFSYAKETLDPSQLENYLNGLSSTENCNINIRSQVNLYNNEYLSIIVNDNKGNKVYFSTRESITVLPNDLRETGYFFEVQTTPQGTKYVFIKNEFTDTTFGSTLKTLEKLTISSSTSDMVTAISYKRKHEKNGWFSSQDIVDEVFNCKI